MNQTRPCQRCGSKLTFPGESAVELRLTPTTMPDWFPPSAAGTLPVRAWICLDCGAVEWEGDAAVLGDLRQQLLQARLSG